MSRMLDALRQIEVRRPPERCRPEGRRVDETTIEQALERVEAATILAAAGRIDEVWEPDQSSVAMATGLESVVVEAPAEPKKGPGLVCGLRARIRGATSGMES